MKNKKMFNKYIIIKKNIKKIILVMVGIVFINFAIKAQWHQSLLEGSSLINRVSVINDNVLWVADQYRESFSYSVDGGTN